MTNIYLTSKESKKKKRKRRITTLIVTIFILLALAILSVVIASFVKANKIMSEEAAPLSPFAGNILPRFTDTAFRTLDGQTTLRAWWFNSQAEETKATVIMVHDQSMNRLPFDLESKELFETITNSGCNLLSFDLRNRGQSDGNLSSFGYMESEDVLAALAYVNRVAPNEAIILYGFGSGTTAIMRALIQLEELLSQDYDIDSTTAQLPDVSRIKGLILDTAARSSDNFIAARLAREEGLGRYFYPRTVPYAIRLSSGNKNYEDYLNYLSQLTKPVLMLGLEHDSILPESAYVPLWKERLRLQPTLTDTFQVEGSGHLTAYLKDKSAYCRALEEFIEQNY